MKCDVCNSTEFVIIDGQQWCTECQNNIPGSRVEENYEKVNPRGLLRRPKEERSTAKAKKKPGFQCWTSFEAYNVILIKQVSALIKLGASEQLKTVVLHLWSQYLQKCEVAFRVDSNAHEQTPCLTVMASKRDKEVLYGIESIRRQTGTSSKQCTDTSSSDESDSEEEVDKSRRKLSRTSSKQCKDTNSVQIGTSDETNIKEEVDNFSVSSNQSVGAASEINGLDDLLKTSEDEQPSETPEKIMEVKFSSHDKKILKKKGKKLTSTLFVSKYKDRFVHCMAMLKTLCFCYLGLLYTEDQLTLLDLLRLVNEGKIPYINITDHFPPSMKVQAYDSQTFNTSKTPTLREVSLMCGKMCKFLNLPKYKHHALMPIAYCFVKDLNLPNQILHVVKKIIDMIQYETYLQNNNTERLPLYEVQAMAAIMVALKWLYVLDGQYENEHSDTMMTINNLNKDNQLFVWNEWWEQLALKDYLFLERHNKVPDLCLVDSLSVDQYTNCSLPKLISNVDTTNPKTQYTRYVKTRDEAKCMLQDLIKLKLVGTHKASSFPLKRSVSYFVSNWKDHPSYKATNDIDFTFITKDFSTHLLFCTPDQMETEDSIQKLISSLCESANMINSLDEFSSEEINQTQLKYWATYKSLLQSEDNWIDKLPPTFVKLLKLLSKYIFVSYKELYVEMLKVEKRMFKVNIKRE